MKAAVSEELRDTIESRHLRGQIHSTYKNTVNMICDGKLVSVLLTDGKYPGSICLEESPMWWEKIRPYDNISVDSDEIRLNGKHMDFLTGIRYFDSRVTCVEDGFTMEDLRNALLQVEFFLKEKATGLGAEGLLQELSHGTLTWNYENPYVEFLKPRLAYMLESLHQQDWNQIEDAISGFMGCGPGLTPSSDDFLCGFLMITGMYDRSLRNGSQARHLKEVVDSTAAARTTAVSAKYMMESADGMATDVMRQLLYAIACGQNDLQTLLELQSQVGSTSGTDTLTGLCFGMDYILKERGV